MAGKKVWKMDELMAEKLVYMWAESKVVLTAEKSVDY